MDAPGFSDDSGPGPRTGGGFRRAAPFLAGGGGVAAIALGVLALVFSTEAGAATPEPAPEHPVVVEQPRVVVAKPTHRPGKYPQVVGHRGGSRWGAESTLPTLRHADEIGADGVEFDIRFTRDGVPVLMHDRTVNRTTNCTGLVTDLVLTALKECEAGTEVLANPFAGEVVPTLDEALAEIAPTAMKVYVHVKHASADEATAVVALLDKYGMNTTAGVANRSVVMADNPYHVEALKAAGAKRLGLVIERAYEWKSPYHVIVVRGAPVTKAIVDRAHRAGKFVVAVEGFPVRSAQVRGLGVDGFMADDLDGAVANLGTAVTRAAAG